MKRRVVVSPSDEKWVIALRWLPWSPQWRGARLTRREPEFETEPSERSSRWGWLDLAEPFAYLDEGCLPILGFVFAITLVVGMILFVLPIFLLVAEILIVILAVVIGIVVRVIFRRPWLVDAVSSNGANTEFVWAVVGYRRSREVIDDVARQLEAGVRVPVVADAKLAGQRATS